MSEKNILNNSTEIMDYNNPLTREEMIAYSTVLVDANNKKLDSIANFYKEQNKILAAAVKDLAASMISIVGEVRNQGTALYEIKNELSGFANSQEEIKSSIDKAAETFKTVSFTIDKRQREAINENNKPINPLFFSTKDARFNSLWIEKVRGDIANICIDLNKDKGRMYKDLYKAMNDEGYDLNSLLSEYRKSYPNASMLEMICASDAMRNMFCIKINSHAFKSIMKKKNGTMNPINQETTDKIRRKSSTRSDCMKNIVNKYFGVNKLPTAYYKKIYSFMGIDNASKYVSEAKKKYNLTKYSHMADVLAREPEMLAKFEEAIIRFILQNPSIPNAMNKKKSTEEKTVA